MSQHTPELREKPCKVCGEVIAWDDTAPVVCNECKVRAYPALLAALKKAHALIQVLRRSPYLEATDRYDLGSFDAKTLDYAEEQADAAIRAAKGEK